MTGGSIGVALFGAIFAHRLAAQTDFFTSGIDLGAILQGTPANTLPQSTSPYAEAIAIGLKPAFSVAAVMGALAFVLAVCLPEFH